jgi:N-methylhydantoinase A/oxoprolinase/acetone carboxylase beta subunit
MERLINVDNDATLTDICVWDGTDGGTTTDVGSVPKEEILTDRRGSIEGAPISIPMSDVQSSGVGGKTLAMPPVVFDVAGYRMVSL